MDRAADKYSHVISFRSFAERTLQHRAFLPVYYTVRIGTVWTYTMCQLGGFSNHAIFTQSLRLLPVRIDAFCMKNVIFRVFINCSTVAPPVDHVETTGLLIRHLRIFS